MQEEFDKFADEYYTNHLSNIRLSGESPEYFAEYKIRDLFRLLSPTATQNLRILDFGCGVGNSTPWLQKYFGKSQFNGVDVSIKSLDIARSRYSDIATFSHYDGRTLPYDDNTFDAAVASCVFHHIPGDRHHELLSEIRRVLKIQGRILVHEHNPLNPLTRHAVNTCPFDENAVLIWCRNLLKLISTAGFEEVEREYRIFFPNKLKFLRLLEKHLKHLPLGAQYFVTGIKK
jgi:ubiquinone/menaquinone biosynthesis C-methylase UbiE